MCSIVSFHYVETEFGNLTVYLPFKLITTASFSLNFAHSRSCLEFGPTKRHGGDTVQRRLET
jgi:hypothetical protein